MADRIVIIGNGISGITAARHIRKNSDKDILVISGETDHFYSRTALMYIFMGHMKYENTKPYEDNFWKKNRIELKRAWVKHVHPKSKSIEFASGESISYDKLILACGSKSNKFGWPGQDLEGVQGLYHYQDLESLEEQYNKGINRAVIVGGGLIGIELAEMFLSRNVPVTMLVREKSFWNNVLPIQESELINRHIREHHIDLRLADELDSIEGDENGRVKSVVTKSGEKIACQFVGLTVGVSPNVDFLASSDIQIKRGIVVNEYLETSEEDIYAIGDCAEFESHPVAGRRNIEQVWYTGRMMGETIAQTICGNKTAYQPGIWFNSAKFLDIEYQTYGWVMAELRNNEDEFYWEHEGGKMCIHMVFDKEQKVFLGINTFGIRLRHNVCENWIKKTYSMDQVMTEFKDALFDPEFYKDHVPELVQAYNAKFGTSIKPSKLNWRRILTLQPH